MEPFSIIIIATAISIFLSAGTATAVYTITKKYDDEEEQEEFVISEPVLISCSEQREVSTNQDTQVIMHTLPTINSAQDKFVISEPVLISCSEQREVPTNQDTQVIVHTLPTINPAQDKFVEMLCALSSKTSKEISETADQVTKEMGETADQVSEDVSLLGHKIAYGIYETTDGC